jgi:uncharacterized membrane protein
MTFRMTDPYRIKYEPFTVESDNGRTVATVNYALYIAGFFTGITAFVGVLLAYLKRGAAAPLARSHFDWQIRIFWRGVAAGIVIFVLHWLVVGLAAITFGIGFIFMVVPWVIGVCWLVWTIWAIIKGLQRLGRGQPIH